MPLLGNPFFKEMHLRYILMNYLDLLPLEILDIISVGIYRELLVYPRFARNVTVGRRFDEMIARGYDVRVEPEESYMRSSTSTINGELIYRKYPGVLYDETGRCIQWRLNGLLHYVNGPAVILEDGTTKWYIKGRLHREDGPAVVYGNGTVVWCYKGSIHREGAPAIVYPDGGTEWHTYGKLVHASDPMPAISYSEYHGGTVPHRFMDNARVMGIIYDNGEEYGEKIDYVLENDSEYVYGSYKWHDDIF